MEEIDLTQDSDEREKMDTTKVGDIGNLCEEHVRLTKEITILEERIARRKERISRLELEEIPEAMRQAKTSEFKLYDGSKVEVKPFIKLTIPEEKKPAAYQWFRENNFGDLIKRNLTVALVRGQDELASQVKEMLKKFQLDVVDKEDVHYQTLQAFAREQIRKGVHFPEDKFTSFSGMKATIKLPKE